MKYFTAGIAALVLVVFAISRIGPRDGQPTRNEQPNGVATPPSELDEAVILSPRSNTSRSSLPSERTRPEPEEAGSSIVDAKLNSEEQLAEHYGSWTLGDLVEEHEKISSHLDAITVDVYRERFDMGDYEVVGTGGSHTFTKLDVEGKLTSFNIAPNSLGGEVKKVTLRDYEYPELYAVKKRLDWVRSEIQARQKDKILQAGQFGSYRLGK